MQNIQEAICAGLWPLSKEITSEKGIKELEELGYHLFYIGKNADLYFIPGNIPKALVVRTDRTSVFDIPLDLEIKEKGYIQNKISNFGFDFAENMRIKTSRLVLPRNIPDAIALCSQAFELCEPIKYIDLEGSEFGLELIFRNYMTGSLYKSYKEGLDPYNLCLPKGIKEWDKFSTPIFTPTTKGKKDIPLNSMDVENTFPKIVQKLMELFVKFSEYAYGRGVIIVDTKLEVFFDSNLDWVLGDEVLTPESSRFITVENFENGIFESMDKQILRNFGLSAGWIEQAKELKPGQKLHVDVPVEIKNQIIAGYNQVYNMIS